MNAARSAARTCGTTSYAATVPLTWDSRLANAAIAHSQYQLSINTMTHTGSGGSNVGQRATAAGYPWRTVGENVAWNYPTEAAVMAGWLGSPGHCANIMNPAFRHLGVAKAGAYWTMVLGAT